MIMQESNLKIETRQMTKLRGGQVILTGHLSANSIDTTDKVKVFYSEYLILNSLRWDR